MKWWPRLKVNACSWCYTSHDSTPYAYTMLCAYKAPLPHLIPTIP